MSMVKALPLFKLAINELRARPLFFLALGALHVMFLYAQQLLPIFGPILSSIAITLLVARLFARELHWKLAPFLGLALLSFPINMLWTLLMSLHRNTSWVDVFSSGWSIPAMFFMCLILIAWTRAVRLALIEKTGLDQSLKRGWVETMKNFGAVVAISMVMSLLIALSMEMHGIGLIVVAPLGYALLKVLSESGTERAVA